MGIEDVTAGRLYTVTETSELLKCSRSQVFVLLNTGQLRAVDISAKGSRRLPRVFGESILEYLTSKKITP